MPEALVDLIIEDSRWATLGLGPIAERAAGAALEASARAAAMHEISLLACDDARIAALNATFRGKGGPTNVLAWPSDGARGLPGEPVFLGDLALAYETCAREAAESGLALADHAAHLVVHGVLHLLGHDHAQAAEAERMEALETKILASLGVANPYSP